MEWLGLNGTEVFLSSNALCKSKVLATGVVEGMEFSQPNRQCYKVKQGKIRHLKKNVHSQYFDSVKHITKPEPTLTCGQLLFLSQHKVLIGDKWH